MSLFGTGLTVRYRRFRAHHEHTYPIAFFLIGLMKFVLEIAFLCVACICLFLLALKVAGGKSGFIAANDVVRPITEPNAVLTASAEINDSSAANASFSSVSIAEELTTGKRTVNLSSENKPVPVTATATNAVANAVTSVALVSEKTDSSDTRDIQKLSETASDLSGSLSQKVVVARSKDGANVDQVAAIYDQEWILNRPRNRYVIQLASSPRLDKLLDFSRELGSDSEVAVFPFKVSSSQELLYGVAVGDYPTVQQAMQVVKNYPDSIKRYSPWVRRLSDVQKDIKSIAIQTELQLTPVLIQ